MFLAANLCETNAQRKGAKPKTGKICGNPQITCRNRDFNFEPHELGFELYQGKSIIAESEVFYSIILKTVKIINADECATAVSEEERLEIQKLFPNHKVFALKCLEAGSVYYTNTADDVDFIAVYAGKTLAEAKKFLATVQAAGKFKGANIRRMQAGINGT